MKGNRSGTPSLVIIILLIDDAPTDTQSMKPNTTKQTKETNELETLVQYARLGESNS